MYEEREIKLWPLIAVVTMAVMPVWRSNVAQAKNAANKVNDDDLCRSINNSSSELQFRIVGVYYHERNMKFLIQNEQQVPPFRVHEFEPAEVFSTIIDSHLQQNRQPKIREVREIWPQLNNRIEAKTIIAITSLQSSSDEGEKSLPKMILVHEHKSEIYDPEMKTIKRTSNRFDGSAPLIGWQGEGILLTKIVDKKRTPPTVRWYYQAVKYQSSPSNDRLWPLGPAYLLAEVEDQNPIFDSEKERYFKLIDMPDDMDQNDNIIASKYDRRKKLVNWRWAAGYLSGPMYHIYTDQGVYHFSSKNIFQSMEQTDNKRSISFKVLKLPYQDYFMCNHRHTNISARNWNRANKGLIYLYGKNGDTINASFRENLIYALFGAHLVVALLMVAIIVIMQTTNTSAPQKSILKSKYLQTSSKSDSKISRLQTENPQSSNLNSDTQ